MRIVSGTAPKALWLRRVRQPTWSAELAGAVHELRELCPRWGKDKLAPLLRQAGWSVSASMVGRILAQLRRRGVLREPPAARVAVRKPRPPRPYASRKPKTYLAKRPGDIVQHFTARDAVSR